MVYNFDEPFEKPIEQRKTGSGWWIRATSSNGRLVIFGSFPMEDDANNYGFRHFGQNFEVVWLPTRDTGKATRMLKKQLFDQVNDLDRAIARASHKPE